MTEVKRAALTMLLSLGLGLSVTEGPVSASSTTSDADGDGDQLSDAFEIRWGITDPNDDDTDGDGVLDPAEDPDGDRLSNRGEQHYGTSPSSADTDGDGVRDGVEDRDDDGLNDAREQDRRPVPTRLRPSLGSARSDVAASYANGCHTTPYGRSIHPCVVGDPSGSIRITLFGDSHALQWLPALERIGKARHWKIVTITKSACPSVDVSFQEPYFPGALPSCRMWRERGSRWIRSHHQDLVIISNSRGYRLIDGRGSLIPASRRHEPWGRGLARTLETMPVDQEILVLGDTPLPRVDVPACLRAHPKRIDACVRRRSRTTSEAHDVAERAAADAHGATFGSLSLAVCPYDPCPVIVSDRLIWRDRSHLTATYARQLAPSLRKLIVSVIGASAAPTPGHGSFASAHGEYPRQRVGVSARR